ncbi:phosphodiester glycosidase family protein [Pseudonocardia xinjiangensis]|uniref:Phosphodiester glycosidase family protein n=1 Tax=Pseudonocardia xinjiangensis TaxID=75289 RepID=A0ABX1RH33_9PSEU|nr:phosphodiester glycosidase family protein [Pseudonocardia xinjiangensis]NMH79667.1 phosphodiester glycosidase family protein [Pseudonocardia xinjiangensis]
MRRSLLVVVVVWALVTPVGIAVSAELPAPAPVLAVATADAPTPVPPIPQGWPAVSSASATKPVEIIPGVTRFSESYLTADGPQHVQVLQVDLGHGSVRVDTVESHDRIVDPANESTTSMGARTGAVAGINGDFFAIHASGAPLGGVVRDGVLLKSPRPDFAAQVAIANRRATVGEVDFTGQVTIGAAAATVESVNTVEDASLEYYTAGAAELIRKKPVPRAIDGITEITSDLGAVATIPAGTLVIAHRDGKDAAVIDQVRPGATSVPALGPDQVGLLGGGPGADWLTEHAKPGARMRVSTDLSRTGIDALIGGATVLVRDGAVFDDPTGMPPRGRNPETMIGVSKDGRQLTLVVIDGRQESSIGVTPREAAEYLVAHGVDSGVLLDGGGSSTLAARLPGTTALTVLNQPSDATGERPVANGLFVYSR